MEPLLILSMLAAATTAGGPAPETPKAFRDWAVACDNVKRCAMTSLGGEGTDFPPMSVELARAAGPAGGYEIALHSLEDKAPVPVSLDVDGRRFPVQGDGLAGPKAAAVAAALADGRVLTVRGEKGAVIGGRISLAGASAALRFIDAAQGRAGTVTATVARGPAAAATVPAAPMVPVVVSPTPGGNATATPAQLSDMRRIAKCREPMPDNKYWNPDLVALGGGATLVILPCSAGAYNLIGALFVIRDGAVTPAETDAPAGFEATGADSQTPVHSVINGRFDGGLLTSYAKGRGLGDCGVSQSFAWDGARLRLVEQTEMRECRGNPNFLRTWHARVARR